MQSTTGGPAATKKKRPWTRPCVTGTMQAFEHSVLSCTGRRATAPTICINSAPAPKGSCTTTTGCVNLS